MTHLRKKTDGEGFLAVIEKIIIKRPYYGYRRITHQLKREGYEIGEEFIRTFKEEHIGYTNT